MSKKDIQGYLGLYMLVGIGLVLLNLVSPPISRSFFMGLILAASGAAGLARGAFISVISAKQGCSAGATRRAPLTDK